MRGNLELTYIDKIFGKTLFVSDMAHIDSTNSPLNVPEKRLFDNINNLIVKELNKKGYQLETFNLIYSPEHSVFTIIYRVDQTFNEISFNLHEDLQLVKKANKLASSLVKRLMREHK